MAHTGHGASRPRVLFVAHSMEVGGAERTLLMVMQHHAGLFTLSLAAPDGPMLDSFRPLCRTVIGLRRGGIPLSFNVAAYARAAYSTGVNLIRLRRFLRVNPVDLVFTNTGVVLHGPAAARLYRLPSVVMVHEIVSPSWLRRFLNWLLKRWSQRVVVMSEAVRAAVGPPRSSSQVVKVPAAVALHGTDGAGDVRGPRNGARSVGVVGTVQPIKGQDYFLRMAAKVLQRHPSTRFIIAGAYRPRSRYVLRLQRLCRQLGLLDHVVFTGPVESVASIMRQLDVLAVPSVTESLSMVSLEAMALAKPVVAFNVGGLPEVVEDGVTGRLVPFGDYRAMAEAVDWLLEHPQEAARMGAAGRARVKLEFDAAEQCKRVETVLMETMKAAGGR
jgi:glycosyltransferase involved in cell wall biosynthesis